MRNVTDEIETITWCRLQPERDGTRIDLVCDQEADASPGRINLEKGDWRALAKVEADLGRTELNRLKSGRRKG